MPIFFMFGLRESWILKQIYLKKGLLFVTFVTTHGNFGSDTFIENNNSVRCLFFKVRIGNRSLLYNKEMPCPIGS